jgi:hypothetical protein
LTEAGRVVVDGRSVPYVIHRLPVNSFPDLPQPVADALNRRGCMIPQTYEAHRPENIVHGSLERAGSADWAVLCSAHGTVSLLVFFASATGEPQVVASAPEKQRLQVHDLTGVLGFNWGIDAATPEQVRQAQSGMEPRPARVDHDALEDMTVDHTTVFHFYSRANWFLLGMPG